MRLNLTPTGSANQQPPGARLVVTEAGVRFSFRVRGAGWESFSSIPTKKSPRGPERRTRDSNLCRRRERAVPTVLLRCSGLPVARRARAFRMSER
jgi:hypothetical protein